MSCSKHDKWINNIIPQTCRIYSWILLSLEKVFPETLWSLSLVSPLFVEFGFTKQIPLRHSTIRRQGQIPCFDLLLSSTCIFIKTRWLWTTDLPLCGRCIHSFLRMLYKDLFIRHDFDLSKSTETRTCHNTYGVVSTNLLDVPLYFKWVFAYFDL